nr:hypothetical protein [Tanacetum cinerariifolium]
MVANSIDTVTSVLTQKELDLFCVTYNIPAKLRPELPGREDMIKDTHARKNALDWEDMMTYSVVRALSPDQTTNNEPGPSNQKGPKVAQGKPRFTLTGDRSASAKPVQQAKTYLQG